MEKLALLLAEITPKTKSSVNISSFESLPTNLNYVAEIRTSFGEDFTGTSKDQCKEWIRRFSEETKTNWIVKKTYPNAVKYNYRVIYVCQHNSFNKVSTRTGSNTRIRDKNCCALINIVVKNVTRDTQKKDPHTKEGRNVSIEVNCEHSHRTNVSEAYSYLRISEETEVKFEEYFASGMTPSSAKAFHELQIMMDASGDDDSDALATQLADAQTNPLLSHVSYSYNIWRKRNFGDRSHQSIVAALKAKQSIYNDAGIELYIHSETPMVIVIITPIMRRFHAQSFAGEQVFVDSSGSCDQSSTCVTFMFAASKIGAAPLACVLHTGQSEENYIQAFEAIKIAAGGIGFGGKGRPQVFMTDDSKAEINALKHVFPDSTTLLCIFHLLQALWRWLWNGLHNIHIQDRKPLMQCFRKVVYASTISDCENNYELLLANETVGKYPLFLGHVAALWSRKSAWCIALRASLFTRGNNTNNFVEASIRIFKDIVLQRCKAFNAAALIDFISVTFESYHKRRLLEFANSRSTKPTLAYNKFVERSKSLVVSSVNSDTFEVGSSKNNEIKYTVHAEIGHCECSAGQGGAFCKHICAVELQTSIIARSSPKLNSQDKALLAQIALGEKAPLLFYDSMDFGSMEDVSATNETAFTTNEENEDSEIPLSQPGHDSDDEELHQQHSAVVQGLEQDFKKITDMLLNLHPSPALSKRMLKWRSTLQNVTTPSQVEDFIFKTPLNRASTIKVQPTSISRRKYRKGLTSGAKRVQAGRPSNLEAAGRSKNKKVRNLGGSINANTSNAKSHGSGH